MQSEHIVCEDTERLERHRRLNKENQDRLRQQLIGFLKAEGKTDEEIEAVLAELELPD